MNLLRMSGSTKKMKCDIVVTETFFVISGDYYYLLDKEFMKVLGGRDVIPISEYMGLGVLKKRSPKKMFFFIGAAFLLEVLGNLSDKINNIFSEANIEWMNNLNNVCAMLALVIGIGYFFSKKSVYEISFRTKRICVDEKSFLMEDMKKLDKIMLELR